MTIEARKASFDFRLKQFGGPLNEPAVKAQMLAQVEHESDGFRHVREIWGPTKAQVGYEGRKDLGNTQPGDGKRFMGRDVLQVTGRANYRSLTAWVRKAFGKGPDFEAQPELLESPEWLGIGAIWYFLTRKDLLRFCREGNIEMVTRRVNGGLNGYADRLKRYDRIALGMLGHATIRDFQKVAGLAVDGISGPKTRAAMHGALVAMGKPVAAPAASVTSLQDFGVRPRPDTGSTIVATRSPKAVPAAVGLAALAAAAWQWGQDAWAWLINLF